MGGDATRRGMLHAVSPTYHAGHTHLRATLADSHGAQGQGVNWRVGARCARTRAERNRYGTVMGIVEAGTIESLYSDSAVWLHDARVRGGNVTCDIRTSTCSDTHKRHNAHK